MSIGSAIYGGTMRDTETSRYSHLGASGADPVRNESPCPSLHARDQGPIWHRTGGIYLGQDLPTGDVAMVWLADLRADVPTTNAGAKEAVQKSVYSSPENLT